mmetsp:Transcript_22373/g.62321  ORF Transcript_22373/g.62321 Transcript_22373/m.62321 type:complete len:238 (-) Transcript_22373:807-1520(-)
MRGLLVNVQDPDCTVGGFETKHVDTTDWLRHCGLHRGLAKGARRGSSGDWTGETIGCGIHHGPATNQGRCVVNGKRTHPREPKHKHEHKHNVAAKRQGENSRCEPTGSAGIAVDRQVSEHLRADRPGNGPRRRRKGDGRNGRECPGSLRHHDHDRRREHGRDRHCRTRVGREVWGNLAFWPHAHEARQTDYVFFSAPQGRRGGSDQARVCATRKSVFCRGVHTAVSGTVLGSVFSRH